MAAAENQRKIQVVYLGKTKGNNGRGMEAETREAARAQCAPS